MNESKGFISSIETMGLADGPGIRVVFFLQGCPLRCLFCHNPETWAPKGGIPMTPSEVVEKIMRYKNYFGTEGGVTFSGGEPLYQREFLQETIKLCKKYHIHTALDTSGVGEGYEEILADTDLVIWDVKAYEADAYEEMTSKKIEASLEFLETCQRLNKKMWIRQVIVPGMNDTKAYIDGLAAFLKPLKNIEKIELLPYQTLGTSKYEELGILYRLEGTPAMDAEKCKQLETYLLEKVGNI
ncbi:MAG: pyruvate formate-lyase-activating protein [Bacilli bacterium]|nr:pyruvate formate-lyase-activating protein [Bacilli bacterium]